MKVVKKNKDYFTQIYLDYYPLVFSAVYSKINDKDEVNDICQEVFIILYNKLDEIENIRKWLYGTLKNVVLQHFHKKRGDEVNLDEIFDDVGVTFVNGFRDTRIILSETIEQLDLTEDEKTTLDLIATHNFTYTHVARTKGLSRRQVEYKYEKIVKQIIEHLKKKGIKDVEDML